MYTITVCTKWYNQYVKAGICKKNESDTNIIGKHFNLDLEVFTSKQQIYCQFLKVHI